MKTVGKAVEKAFAFTLVYSGPAELTQKLEDTIFEAGCDDALLGIVEGRLILDFHRKAPSLREALFFAVNDVERTGLPIRLIGFESA